MEYSMDGSREQCSTRQRPVLLDCSRCVAVSLPHHAICLCSFVHAVLTHICPVVGLIHVNIDIIVTRLLRMCPHINGHPLGYYNMALQN